MLAYVSERTRRWGVGLGLMHLFIFRLPAPDSPWAARSWLALLSGSNRRARLLNHSSSSR